MKYWRKPLDQDKIKPAHGQIQVIKDRCKGCGFCIGFCPKHVLEESADFNQKGYHFAYAARPDECAGCGLCEMICPDFAITVTAERKEEATSV